MFSAALRLAPRVLVLSLLSTGPAFAQPLPIPAERLTPVVGTGATFPAKVYRQWAADYSQQTGLPMEYKPAGSSAGVKAISRKPGSRGSMR